MFMGCQPSWSYITAPCHILHNNLLKNESSALVPVSNLAIVTAVITTVGNDNEYCRSRRQVIHHHHHVCGCAKATTTTTTRHSITSYNVVVVVIAIIIFLLVKSQFKKHGQGGGIPARNSHRLLSSSGTASIHHTSTTWYSIFKLYFMFYVLYFIFHCFLTIYWTGSTDVDMYSGKRNEGTSQSKNISSQNPTSLFNGLLE